MARWRTEDELQPTHDAFMGLFDRIKEAIFRGKHESRPLSPNPQVPVEKPKPAVPVTTSAGIPASPVNAAWEPREEVDVEAVLTNLSSKNPQKLNWKTSIVDLMKLLDIDSSLANRKELAKELGYSDDTSDTAAMNAWLHKRVMQELERNGGKVPQALLA